MNHGHHFHQHAAHDENDHVHKEGETEGKFKPHVIGLFLGLLAVLIAICAAFGNSEQNKMTHVMIAQARVTSKEVAASVKLRLVLMELAQAAALTKELRNNDAIVANLHLYWDYKQERDISHELSDSLDPSIENHFEGVEMFEYAQLLAEIAIAIGSIALVLKNRYVYYMSVVLAVLSVSQLVYTNIHVERCNLPLDQKVASLEKRFSQLRQNHMKNAMDSESVKALDPDGTILKAYSEYGSGLGC